MFRIVSDPTIMRGDWTVEGTLVPAIVIAAHIHAGCSDDHILEDYPTLPTGAIEAVREWMSGAGVDRTRPLIRNSTHCLLCQTSIESVHRHDLRRCKCGNVAVDGGLEYARRVYNNGQDPGATWVDTSIFMGDQE